MGRQESIKHETGLQCYLELKGLFSSKTYINKAFAYNHQLFIVKATNPRGKLLQKTSKGLNKWVKKVHISRWRILPNIPQLIKIATAKKFRWMEADRFQDGNTFSMEIKKDKEI